MAASEPSRLSYIFVLWRTVPGSCFVIFSLDWKVWVTRWKFKMEVFISSSLSTSLYSVNCKSKAVHYMVVFLYCHYGISVLIRYKQISIRLEPRACRSSQAASASDIDIWILTDVDRMKQIFYPFLMKHLDLQNSYFLQSPPLRRKMKPVFLTRKTIF